MSEWMHWLHNEHFFAWLIGGNVVGFLAVFVPGALIVRALTSGGRSESAIG